MGFLTIDNVNTNNLSIINEFYSLDTSLLGTDDYSSMVYDFVKVSRTENQDNSISFDFEISNSLWTGGFYVTDSEDEYIDVTGDFSYDSTNNLLSMTVEDDIILHLYLCSFYENTYTSFTVEQLGWVQKQLNNINVGGLTVDLESLNGDTVSGAYLTYYHYHDGSWSSSPLGYKENLLHITTDLGGVVLFSDSEDGNKVYVKLNHVKNEIYLSFNTSSVYKGVLNKVKLNIDFSSSFDGVLDGYALFENEKSVLYKEGNKFYFDLDLRDYTSNRVDVDIFLNETEYNDKGEFSFSFNVDYEPVTTEESLLSLVSVGGVVNLANDINLSDDILIINPVKIYGNNHSIDLNNHSIILSEGVDFKAENLHLQDGDSAIIQAKNSKLELNNVSFENCISTKYNNQGACILCDIDINSLDNPDDYITVLKDCSFLNNHNCIVHGGELTITDCNYLNNDITYTDKNNVAFLYQVDGNATINGSVFDITYISDTYCSNHEHIGFAQALLKWGETSQINNISYKNIVDNVFNFTETNQCHLFVKYYYPKISECVYSSPVSGREDKAVCYVVSNLNWVYKDNIMVSRASSGNENQFNPLRDGE